MSQLAARWCRHHEVHLLTWALPETDRYSVPSQVIRHGFDLLRHSRHWWQGVWANWQRVHALRGKMFELQPDLVLSFTDQVNIVTLQAARGGLCPVWIAEHSDPRHQRLRGGWELWRRRMYPRAAGCVVLTDSIAQHMAQWVPTDRIRVIPAAVADVPAGVRCGVEEHRQQIVFVGRLSEEKGVDRLVEAWKRIANRLTDWKLTIVGDGRLRGALERQAEGVPRVEFRGWLDDPTTVYRQGGIFVLPSRYEGFPVALLEAMSYGLPCVVTRCTDAVDLLEGGGTALEVIEPDAGALADRLLVLVRDTERRAILADRGAAIAARYQWRHIGPMWDQLLDAHASLQR
ncbi:MAG: glycosyl transferase [Pirellulaceae bacterium]|nr:MAG: glycosyl transferase [Pirellulaceae bacterium]